MKRKKIGNESLTLRSSWSPRAAATSPDCTDTGGLRQAYGGGVTRCVTTRKIPLNIDISYLPDAQRFASPYVPTDECKKIGTEKQIRDLIFCLLLHALNLELL